MYRGLLCAIILALPLVSCDRKITPEDAHNFVQNSDLQRVSWQGQVPILLYVHHSVDAKYYAPIQRAVDQWNKSFGRDLLKIQGWGTTGYDTPGKDNVSLIYWNTEWDADKPTEQARTTIYWSGNRIYEADMRLNAHNFNFYSGEDPNTVEGVDLQSLVLHELGHVFGLAHTNTIGSVMVPTLASNIARRIPGPLDIQSLKYEY